MLKKINRLRKEKEINLFFGAGFKKLKGYSASSKYFLIKKLPSKENSCRFGFIVNLKVDKKAVVRNKIKRRLRDIVRRQLDQIKPADYLVVALPASKNLDFQQTKEDVFSLLKRLRAL